MSKYPKKPAYVYSEQIGVRLEPELKQALDVLKATTQTDIQEAIRIKLRELVKELQPAA